MRIWIAALVFVLLGWIALVFVLLGWTSVSAQAAAPGTVMATHVWGRATPPGATTGAVYLTLVNTGSVGDQLVGASSPVAEKIQFHSEMDDAGVMKMRELTSIDVAAGGTVVLKPSTTHLMLLRLKHQLVDGQTFPLTLTLQKAGPIEVEVRVGKVGVMHEPSAAASPK